MNTTASCYVFGIFFLLSNVTIHTTDDSSSHKRSHIHVLDAIINNVVQPTSGLNTSAQFVHVGSGVSCQAGRSHKKIFLRFWMGSKLPCFTYADVTYDVSKKTPVATSCGGYTKEFEPEFTQTQNKEIQDSKNAILREHLGESSIPKNAITAAVTLGSHRDQAHVVVVTPTDQNNQAFQVKVHPLKLEAEQPQDALHSLTGEALYKAAYNRVRQLDALQEKIN